jgi:hypothetical protein
MKEKAMRSLVRFMIATALAFVFAPTAFAGRIIVNHDEWTLSDTGAASAGAANVSTFIGNVASFMNIDGGACNFLVYSSNFGVTQAAFTSGMSAAGCSITAYTGVFNTGVGTLADYDGVFLALPPATYDPTALASYVNSGGSAYIAAGTGIGGSVVEAGVWDPFLNLFGLDLGAAYNGCCGVDPVEVTHVIETGVSQLYYNNGNTVTLVGGNPNAQIIEFSGTGLGLIGVYDDVGVTPVPEPGTLLCLVLALAAIRQIWSARRSPRGLPG